MSGERAKDLLYAYVKLLLTAIFSKEEIRKREKEGNISYAYNIKMMNKMMIVLGGKK